MKCEVCKNEYDSPSLGGPGICPSCDCGNPPIKGLSDTVPNLIAQGKAQIIDTSLDFPDEAEEPSKEVKDYYMKDWKKRFDNYMLEEYGKWKIGRVEAKVFIGKSVEAAYEKSAKIAEDYAKKKDGGWWQSEAIAQAIRKLKDE